MKDLQVIQVSHFFAAGVEKQTESAWIVISSLFQNEEEIPHHDDGDVRDKRIEVSDLTVFFQIQMLFDCTEKGFDVPTFSIDMNHISIG